jgi:hypothetical protein
LEVCDPKTITINEILKREEEKKDWIMQQAKNKKIVPTSNNNKNLHFSCKQFYPTKQIKELIDTQMNHKTDGLIFTPNADSVRAYMNERCFKWKPKHTVDLCVLFSHIETKTPNGRKPIRYTLSFGNDSNITHHSIELPLYDSCTGVPYHKDFNTARELMIAPSAIGSTKDAMKVFLVADMTNDKMKQMISLFVKQGQDRFIGEFALHWSNNEKDREPFLKKNIQTDFAVIKCQLIGERKDKTTPNNFKTFQQTLLNTQEDLSIDWLIKQLV